MKKTLLAMAVAASVTVGSLAQTAHANELGSITFVNNSPYEMTYVIMREGWNCLDTPLPGMAYRAPPNGMVEMPTMRKDGHGCNGEQGIARVHFDVPNYEADAMPFSLTGDSCLVNPNEYGPLNYNLIMTGDCPNYTIEITPAIQ